MSFKSSEPTMSAETHQSGHRPSLRSKTGSNHISSYESKEIDSLSRPSRARCGRYIGWIGRSSALFRWESVDGKPLGLEAGSRSGDELGQVLSAAAGLHVRSPGRQILRGRQHIKDGRLRRREQDWAFQSNPRPAILCRFYKQLARAQSRENMAKKSGTTTRPKSERQGYEPS